MTKEKAYELRQYFEDGSERFYFDEVTGDYFITEHTAPRRVLEEMREACPKAFKAKGLVGYSLYRIGSGLDGDLNEIYAPMFGCELIRHVSLVTW